MRKIISFFAALLILGFSILGEAAHASLDSVCADTPAVSQSHAVVGTLSHADADLQMHDCHFGHCAFTLLLPSAIGSPIPFVRDGAFLYRSPIQSGYRSETLRPPARA